MKTHELVIGMKMLERRLTLYEEKYGVLSENFYQALMSGQLERYDEFDETRADFSKAQYGFQGDQFFTNKNSLVEPK